MSTEEIPLPPISGFYGPGSVGCWYLIVASVIKSWIDEPQHRLRVTNDLVAALSYPFFAVLHLFYLLLVFPKDRVDYLRANLTKIITGIGDEIRPVLEDYDTYYNPFSWDTTGQNYGIYKQVLSINAALRINDNCFFLCLMGIVTLTFHHNNQAFKAKKTTKLMAVFVAQMIATSFSHVLLLVICRDIRYLRIPLHSCTFRVMAVSMGLTIVMALIMLCAPLYYIIQHVQNATTVKGTRERINNQRSKSLRVLDYLFLGLTVQKLGLFILLSGSYVLYAWGVCFCIANLWHLYPRYLFFPGTGTSVFDLDQLPALSGGALVFTLAILKKTQQQHA